MKNSNELKEKSRKAFKQAEAEQEMADQGILRTRHTLDTAEAELSKANDALKASGASDNSSSALAMKEAQQQHADEEERYQGSRARIQESRKRLEQFRDKFVATFGEQP